MKFGPETFGELNAEVYDALHDPGTTAESVALIGEIAAGGARARTGHRHGPDGAAAGRDRP